jgi:hypothetical protein
MAGTAERDLNIDHLTLTFLNAYLVFRRDFHHIRQPSHSSPLIQAMVRQSDCFDSPLLTSPKAPKITANTAKLAIILAWFHKTAVAHSVKDLEKALPQVGSISGMQVKDYLQALSDESMIRVEKIGSGNWYWSFPSDVKKTKEAGLEKSQEEYDKANTTAMELQAKVDEAGAARGEDEDMLTDIGMTACIVLATSS